IVEPANLALRQEHVEAVGMTVSASGLSVIERHIDVVGASEDADPLPLQQRGSHRSRGDGRQLRQCVEQRAPTKVGSSEGSGRAVALDVGGRTRATGVAPLMSSLVTSR